MGGTDSRVAEEGFPTAKAYGLVFGRKAGFLFFLQGKSFGWFFFRCQRHNAGTEI
jgi:hypothetical protein